MVNVSVDVGKNLATEKITRREVASEGGGRLEIAL
jgi:hypothetical protein